MQTIKRVADQIKVVKWEDIAAAFPDEPLGSFSIALNLVDAKVSLPCQLAGAPPVAFSIEAGGRFSIAALNGKGGKDPDGVVEFALRRDDPTSIAAVLVGDDKTAWLKYLVSATAKANVSASGGPVAFAGGASSEVQFADYRAHDVNTRTATHAASDLQEGLRFAVRLSDVQRLDIGDALLFRTAGTLSASVTIEWADVFTSQISTLARLLRSASPIAIKTSLGASVKVGVSIVDDFVVAIARATEDSFSASVNKANIRRADLTSGAGVDVTFADDSQVQQILQQVTAGLLGCDVDQLQRILDLANLEKLPARERALVNDVLARVGLDEALSTISDIRTRVAEVTASVNDAIKRIAKAKVSAGFAYEYRRINTTTTLFETTIPVSALSEVHGALVGGDVAALLDAAERKEIGLTRYLNQKETKTTRAWGFTLGFDKWSLFGKSRRDTDVIERVDELRRRQLAYVGLGRYNDDKNEWGADFKADMAEFVVTPTIDDFDFGLHVTLIKPKQTFTGTDLQNTLDTASAWSICPEAGQDWLRQRLPAPGTRDVEWSFHVKANDEALHAMVPVLAKLTRSDLASALAYGMDPSPDSPLRPSERKQLYGGIFNAVLSRSVDNPMRFSDVIAIVSSAFARVDPDRANLERIAGNRVRFTAAALVDMDSNLLDDVDDLLRGFRLWADAWQRNSTDPKTIPSVFRNLAHYWFESWYVKSLGALLIDVARQTAQIKGIERTLNVTSGGAAVVYSSNDFSTN